MALAISEPIGNIDDGTDASSYAFASFTPAANCTLVVTIAVYAHNTDEATCADSGMGLTWTKRARFTWSSGSHSVYVFEASVGGSPAATVVTITLPTDASTGAVGTMFQITGTSPTFVQSKSATGLAGTPAVTLDAALNTNNCYVLGAGNANNPPNWTPPTSWTEVADIGHPSSEGGYGAYRVNGESGSTVTVGSTATGQWGLIVLEYRESSAVSIPVHMSVARQMWS